jgi:hypothetical protein
MCINIAHIDEEARIRDIRRQRRIQSVFGRHPMQPYGGVTRTHLAMNSLTLGVSIHTPAVEAERADEEVVSRLNVLVRENGNDSLDIGHGALLR